ncbi:hypothetical protein OBBRIDRAFT_888067 [Obba rivulosa]|uniref:Uncharacterized protein n=1 Tax=Obba rivulosa TaxID=1052685 RepID=A0A8E2DLK8_9APHY|nr:hypothetical protein OBBRIDRAFT_888067 [Obba rivulosa]
MLLVSDVLFSLSIRDVDDDMLAIRYLYCSRTLLYLTVPVFRGSLSLTLRMFRGSLSLTVPMFLGH